MMIARPSSAWLANLKFFCVDFCYSCDGHHRIEGLFLVYNWLQQHNWWWLRISGCRVVTQSSLLFIVVTQHRMAWRQGNKKNKKRKQGNKKRLRERPLLLTERNNFFSTFFKSNYFLILNWTEATLTCGWLKNFSSNWKFSNYQCPFYFARINLVSGNKNILITNQDHHFQFRSASYQK